MEYFSAQTQSVEEGFEGRRVRCAANAVCVIEESERREESVREVSRERSKDREVGLLVSVKRGSYGVIKP